jgi:hypothetical protein
MKETTKTTGGHKMETTMKVTVLMNDSLIYKGKVEGRRSASKQNDGVNPFARSAMSMRDEYGYESGHAPTTWRNDLFINNGTFMVDPKNDYVLYTWTPQDACDEMYRIFQHGISSPLNINGVEGGPIRYHGPSMSIGDVVVVDGQAFACTETGWEEISGIQEKKYHLNSSRRKRSV